jgi:hypothetical protein
MTWIDLRPSAATTAFLSQEILPFSLQTIIADPDSAPLFVSHYIEGLSIFIAYFTFHS